MLPDLTTVYNPTPAARYVKGLEDGDLCRAQLGLAHSYSRSKVKFNVNRCRHAPLSPRAAALRAGDSRCSSPTIAVLVCACVYARLHTRRAGLAGKRIAGWPAHYIRAV